MSSDITPVVPESKDSKKQNGTKIDSRDLQDQFTVKVKPEFILSERSPILTPLDAVATNNSQEKAPMDYRDDPNNKNNKRNRRGGKGKNKRGMNKKRPYDQILNDGKIKPCLAIIRGDIDCEYGAEKCKYCHDLKLMLKERKPDISEIEVPQSCIVIQDNTHNKKEDSEDNEENGKNGKNDTKGSAGSKVRCPNFNLFGFCPFGIMCRLGECHVNLETGENLRAPATNKRTNTVSKGESDNEKGGSLIENDDSKLNNYSGHSAINVLTKDVQMKLRKNKYPFKCKRHFEQKKVDNATQDNTVTSTTSATTTPYPTKTRKLIDFSNKVYVAPLTTVGNLPFRRILKKLGADITCGEMALCKNLLEGRAPEWALLKRHPCEDIFGVQLAAPFADQFTRVSEIFINEEMKIDFIDMNLGCPIDLICDKGAGAALMQRDNILKKCVTGMTSTLAGEIPITIKMRTGWNMNSPFAENLVSKIQSWGFNDSISALFVHGRSRLQRYSKLADWEYIHQVANTARSTVKTLNDESELEAQIKQIPVVGNGDIFSYTDYEKKLLKSKEESNEEGSALTPCAMLARGALIKPWLPTEIHERRHWDISATERLDLLKEFVYFGLEHWGSDETGVAKTRRFLLEWLSFLYRYIPVHLLEVLPQQMNHRPPPHLCGRNDLETLMMSKHCGDWIKISEMLLGKCPDGFQFEPKHKASSYK